MFKLSCNMLSDRSNSQIIFKIRDDHSHNTRNRNHLKFSAETKNFTSNSAKIWTTISTKIDDNVNLVHFNLI